MAGLLWRGVEKMDDIGMELLERDELELGHAEGGLETAAVFEDIFFGVPLGVAEIEDFFAVLIRNAAGLGAEAMHKPRKSCESGHLEDTNALDVTLGPGGHCTGAEA